MTSQKRKWSRNTPESIAAAPLARIYMMKCPSPSRLSMRHEICTSACARHFLMRFPKTRSRPCTVILLLLRSTSVSISNPESASSNGLISAFFVLFHFFLLRFRHIRFIIIYAMDNEHLIRRNSFEHFLTAMNIQYFILRGDELNLSMSDFGLKQLLYQNYQYLELAKYINLIEKPGDTVIFQDRFNIVDIVIKVIDAEEGEITLVIGPMLSAPVTREFLEEMLHKGYITEEQLPFLKSGLDDMPIMPYDGRPCSMIMEMVGYVSGLELNIVADEVERFSAGRIFTKAPDPDEARSIAYRYEKENEMLKAIAAGDAVLALQKYDEFRATKAMKRRTPDQVQNVKNYAIILNSLSRKCAEQAGVHPVYIDFISSKFATEINEARSVAYINLISRKIVQSYAELVRTRSLHEYSHVIREIIIYTDTHMDEKLSLSFFAEKFNLSPTYLSALFRKEMKLTLTNYIRKIRLKEAERLLTTTALPLSAIAMKTGYENPSYLIRHFKAEYGEAPRQHQLSSGSRRSEESDSEELQQA